MNLTNLNKLINSELTTKIKNTNIENNELSIDVKVENLYQVILFLKTDEKCKFKQLIDIAAADYPDEEYRFEICLGQDFTQHLFDYLVLTVIRPECLQLNMQKQIK